MNTPDEVLITVDSGVEGDCRGTVPDRQVTVVSADAWRDACRDLGMEVPWTMRRANLFLGGIDLRHSDGSLLAIGDVVLQITGENEPCRVMDIQRQGLRNALKPDWRAGVSCRVLSGGRVRIGDTVRLCHPATQALVTPSHPIRKLYDAGVRVTINTDDMIMFGQSVSHEFLNLYRAGCLNAEELDRIRENGLSDA